MSAGECRGDSSPNWGIGVITRGLRYGAFGAIVFGVVLAAYVNAMPQRQIYVTWEGIGPDKWASIWLITRHIDPKASIEFLSPGVPVKRGVAFDIPDADYQRTPDTTTFEGLMERFDVADQGVVHLAKIVRDLELGGWKIGMSDYEKHVEGAFRDLQRKYGRENVPFGCYMAFFDRLHSKVAADTLPAKLNDLIPNETCAALEKNTVIEAAVPELPAANILERMAAGQKVVFVDTRETAEFDEFRIPGALNIKLREISKQTIAPLLNADLVVPYCVKDFRGYEVARAMQRSGIERVAIMNPYGIKGWRSLGLPVAGKKAASDNVALRTLDNCLKEKTLCATL